MFSINYDNVTYNVEFNTGHPLKWYHTGKTYPKTTQCVIKKFDIILGVGEVVKHYLDTDNPEYARNLAMKKALNNTNSLSSPLWKEFRKILWERLKEYSKNNKNLT